MLRAFKGDMEEPLTFSVLTPLNFNVEHHSRQMNCIAAIHSEMSRIGCMISILPESSGMALLTMLVAMRILKQNPTIYPANPGCQSVAG
jgi:hypothetical protein